VYAALAINIVALEESKPDPESSADYVDINPKADKTLLFVHGWPRLWAGWKYQIQEFQVLIDSYVY